MILWCVEYLLSKFWCSLGNWNSIKASKISTTFMFALCFVRIKQTWPTSRAFSPNFEMCLFPIFTWCVYIYCYRPRSPTYRFPAHWSVGWHNCVPPLHLSLYGQHWHDHVTRYFLLLQATLNRSQQPISGFFGTSIPGSSVTVITVASYTGARTNTHTHTHTHTHTRTHTRTHTHVHTHTHALTHTHTHTQTRTHTHTHTQR